MTISNTLYRLVGYMTTSETKEMNENRIEIMGDKESIFRIWFELSKVYPHIDVYNMGGEKQKPQEGTMEGFKPNKI